MKQTENFVQDSALLLILTAVALFTSSFPYLCMLLCGILLLLLAVRSLTDDPGKTALAVQILISAAFAVLSGSAAAYLILYACRAGKGLQLALPPVSYVAVWIFMRDLPLPHLLGSGLLLFIISVGIWLAEQLAVSCLSAKSQISRSVSVTAVNEMYEKKINQELMIRNYLADKNARLEERETISRNIHNSVGHSITAAIMTLDAADMLFDTAPDKAREKMNAANQRIRSSLTSIRRAVRVLDSENECVSMEDFISELNAVIDSFAMDTMIQIRTDFPDDSAGLLLPHEHTEFLTGALQELLTNGVRHGHADRFTVSMIADSGHLKLCAADNGNSDFSPQNAQERIRNGFGLKKLISYAEHCGGCAVFENKNGFQSAITLPLYKEDGYA